MLLFAASTCFAQTYTVTDLGTLGKGQVNGINALGQVIGTRTNLPSTFYHAFRTAPNSPIDPVTDDLGTLAGTGRSSAMSINNYGEAVGATNYSSTYPNAGHAFLYSVGAPVTFGAVGTPMWFVLQPSISESV